jgi:hypothetical protein
MARKRRAASVYTAQVLAVQKLAMYVSKSLTVVATVV